MKHLKSTLNDLRQLFSRSITLRDIAELLESFDLGQPANDVRTFMEKREYDVVGVTDHGVVVGYAKRGELKNGIVGECRYKFAQDEVLADSEPLRTAFSVLHSRQQIFISVGGHVTGIITRGDLQKIPVRLWLFGLASLLEMQMLRLIREQYPSNSWISSIKGERVEDAQRIFGLRRSRNEGIDLADCLELCDKAEIIKRDADLFKISELSKGKFERFFRHLEVLRNSLAHSNDILNGQWPELVDLVTDIESMLQRFEKVEKKAAISFGQETVEFLQKT